MAGSTAIKIYRNPLKTPKPRETAQLGDHEPAAKTKLKSYDSFLVTYYQGGKRLRTRHNSLQSAQDKANAIKTAILNNDLTALTLKGEDSVIYARAKNLISHLGVALDEVAKEYSDAMAILGNVSLIEAVRFYERFGNMLVPGKSVAAIVQELNAGLKADGKSAYHLRDTNMAKASQSRSQPGRRLRKMNAEAEFSLTLSQCGQLPIHRWRRVDRLRRST